MLIYALAKDTHAALPEGRAGAAGVLIGNKIFIQGGFTSVNKSAGYGYATNEMIILPVDTSFPISEPAFESDSPLITSGSPNVLGGVGFFGGYNNSGMYLFGGEIDDAMTAKRTESSALFLFNTSSYNWTSVTTIPGSWPAARDSFTAVSNVNTSDGFIFGGEYTMGATNKYLFNTTWRLQYGNVWSEIGGIAPGGGRQAHGAAMISGGRMVILGGSNVAHANVPLTTVLVFNPNDQQYITLVTHDDKIIVFGGDDGVNHYRNDLAVLDMKQPKLVWTVPQASGIAPSGRNSHIGLMVGSQMFIMFGATSSESVDNGIYVLDTNTWTWQTTYTPQDLEYTSTALQPPSVLPPSGSDSSSTPVNTSVNSSGSSASSTAPSAAIIGGSVGAAVVLIVVVFAAWVLIRRQKRKREIEKATIYRNPEPEPHSESLSNNMYDSVPPYDPRHSSAAHTSSKDSSTAVNSLGDSASNRLSIMSQKPNVPIHVVYQKPDAED
ncbi:hypothetical protein INT43_004726 [Umbelopsis isabellina]|uniref:Galactose oxidase n=1 Tax=Mortierella isabellina TaxID=91625 RepID=A0A8H7PG51_MORIS|nr:hypothetical protein INT43_004726 [Umbelopsis isabellina]